MNYSALLRMALGTISIALFCNSNALAETEPTRAELIRTIKQLEARVEALEKQRATEKSATHTSRTRSSAVKHRTQVTGSDARPSEHAVAGPSLAMAAPAPAWNGFYVGASTGADALRTSHEGMMSANPGGDPFVGVGGATNTAFSGSNGTGISPLIDVHAGYDWMVGPNVVTGIQVAGSFSRLAAQQDIHIGACSDVACTAQFQFNGYGSTSLDWTVSALARLGFVDGDNLFYGIAGWSWSKLRTVIPTQMWAGNHSDFNWTEAALYANAPTFGLGWERKIYNGWSALIEYRYARFNDASATASSTITNCPTGGGLCQSSTTVHVSSELQSIRLGLNRRFE